MASRFCLIMFLHIGANTQSENEPKKKPPSIEQHRGQYRRRVELNRHLKDIYQKIIVFLFDGKEEFYLIFSNRGERNCIIFEKELNKALLTFLKEQAAFETIR